MRFAPPTLPAPCPARTLRHLVLAAQTAAGFARESQRMDMAGEMMDGALEDALGEGVEEESDEVVAQVGRVAGARDAEQGRRGRSRRSLHHTCAVPHRRCCHGPLQVLDSIGLDLSAQLAAAPRTRAPAAAAVQQEQEQRQSEEADLLARLAALK